MNNGFNIDKAEIDNIFRIYQQRKVNEEIEYINSTHKGIAGLAKKLKTDLNNGISNSTLDLRRQAFDNNLRYREPMPSFWYFVKDAFGDEILQILCLCAIIEISIGLSPFTENPGYDAFDGIGIVFAIMVIVITTAVTNYNKEKKFKQLSDENFKKFQVVCTREGANINLSDEDLLVGDRCKVDMGMIIPADGIIISSTNLKLDEASLTGESNLMRKESMENCLKMKNDNGKYPSPMVFSGTTVKEGEGWMLVLATGPNSAAGKIREHVMQNKEDEESNKTPLEIKLEDIAEDIGKFGLWSAIITLVALLIKLFYSKYIQMYHKNELLEAFIEKHFHNGTYDKTESEKIKNQTYYLLDNYSIWSGIWKDIFQSLILCITIIVVAIPEGLPLAVTLSLSFSVKKMMDDNNLVRHMPACETMGGANYICTDKTGTLTRNKMHVVSFFNNSNKVNVNDVDHENPKNYTSKFEANYYKILRDALINNIDIELDGKGDIIIASSSKTDFAFYDLLRGFNEDLSKKYQQLDRLKFHSDRKRMSSIVKRDDGKYFIYMKGAPEVVIRACTSYLKSNGEGIVDLQKDQGHLKRLDDITKEYSGLTLRNLAIAYKEVTFDEINNFLASKVNTDHLNYDIEKTGFTLIGIAAINDALRQGVPQSVDLCRQACVKVIMITGDDQTIAEAIARNAGIIKANEKYISLTGKDFIERIGGIVCKTCTMDTDKCTCPKTIGQAKIKYPNLEEDDLAKKLKKERIHDMDTFKEIIKSLKVIARARAIDKYALVLGLRELDNVVAVTGDGTNDASALSKADVGFAMGKTGTDVARDAADIIILDDNFNSIVHAIKWGRNIFDNIRKFLQFQLSVNFSAVLLVFVSSCIGSESPITAIQMLWINLIMDSLGSLALSTEDPSDELLYRHPHSKREYIINNTMWKMIIVQSLVQFSLVLYLYLFGSNFIVEDNPERLNMIRQLENCFGDFPAEVSEFKNHKVYYYIMDGKKSSWDPMKHLRRNLDPKVCFFFDRTRFEEDQINNLYEAYKWYTSTYGNTVHMTMIFNTFVFYSLFNQINSRIINNNLNIFHRILDNWMFIAVTSTEMFIQFLLVQYGGLVFKCNKEGLTYTQWCWCLGLAAITFVVNFVLKFIHLEAICDFDWGKVLCCPSRGNEDERLIDEEREKEPMDTQKGRQIELSEIN